jgi:cell division septal protein FtsQ
VQRPARRGQQQRGGGESGAKSWRGALRYVPLVFKFALAVGLGLALFWTYRAAASAAFFQLSAVDVEGAARTSPDEIKAIVRRHVAPTGVWRADLNALGAELRSQPWVRSIVVSRVLPSGVRVRVREREPRLVVRTSAGRFVWVDDEGVLLGTAQPSDKMPPFFIRGLDEAPTDAARSANRARIRRALELTNEWEAAGVANRVSEVNLDDLRDVRAQLAGNDSQIEVRLGKDDFGKRLARALKVLDDLRDSPRGPVVRLDATQEKRVIVGFSSGAQSAGQNSDDAPPADAAPQQASNDTAAQLKNERAKDEAKQKKTAREVKRAGRTEPKSERREQREAKQALRGARENQPKERPPAAQAERPRRVG